MAIQPPQIVLQPLQNADGSASYTAPNGLHSITVGVNYPVEVQYRSDELPESTLVEVNLRPSNGVALVKERHIEQLVKRVLEGIVRLEQTPRMMLQLTLQVTATEVDETLPGGVKDGGSGETYLPLLASAINAAVLGCVVAGVEMRQIAGAALVGVLGANVNDGYTASPGAQERKNCRSLHVFALDGTGELLLAESEGFFKLNDWDRSLGLARREVLGSDGSYDRDGVIDIGLLDLMRQTIKAGVVNGG
jgi:exosome complex component RRP46